MGTYQMIAIVGDRNDAAHRLRYCDIYDGTAGTTNTNDYPDYTSTTFQEEQDNNSYCISLERLPTHLDYETDYVKDFTLDIKPEWELRNQLKACKPLQLSKKIFIKRFRKDRLIGKREKRIGRRR